MFGLRTVQMKTFSIFFEFLFSTFCLFRVEWTPIVCSMLQIWFYEYVRNSTADDANQANLFG